MTAWAAIAPEIVPRSELQGAIALNSMGMNVVRGLLAAGSKTRVEHFVAP